MLAKLKLRFTVATILISAFILSIVMASIILVAGIEVRSGISTKIDRSLEMANPMDFHAKLDFEKSDCILVCLSEGVCYTARSEQYSEEQQSELINKMLSSKEGSYFKYNGRDYVYGVKEAGPDRIFAIYDATGELIAINHIWKIVLVAYGAVLVVIAFVAWGLSSGVVKPVDDALQKQKDLIANASHELKTPLTIIETDLSLVRSGLAETDESAKWLNGIETQTKRMNTLIREMLELSKLESGIAVNVDKVAFSDLLESMTLELEAGCFEKEIELTYDITPSIEIYSDEEKIRKLTSILLNNAYKYTPNGGKIGVKAENKKSQVVVSVTNSGSGIPKEKISHIFERFYKVDESHSEESNSFGLGLAIAKSLVDSLCGWIKCDSKENEYTMFTYAIPSSLKKQEKTDNQ